jgi:hypothetical protein
VPKLTEDEQRAIVGKRLSDTLNSSYSELRNDREKALDFYHGRPMGNEQEGRAQVVSKDMMDTIEWMMPSLLRIFAMKDAVQFDPVGPEDELLAKQETAYVTHVLWKKNPGFMILYNWIKDALMQKVGYVKYWWEDEEKVCFDHYTGLTDDQLLLTLDSLQQQGEVDIVGSEQDDDGTWSIKIKQRKKYGCAKIEVTPPEEIIVDSQCRGDVKKAKFAGHLRKLTRSDLLQMGYSRAQVEKVTDYRHEISSEELARDTVAETLDDDKQGVDWATTELTLLECYTYLDVDDDGIAELRHYLMGGDIILENEEFPEIPLESWTPIPVPHRHVGLSIYDIMEDLQRIKTALQRGLLDNVYFTNAPRLLYDKNTVDVSMLQINRPGGHVANDGPVGAAAMPMPVNPMAGQLLPVIDYMDAVKETRTGVGRMTSGVDADVLAQSTKGAYVDAKSAANQRIEAIARIFAETGMSSLYGSLHRLLSRHQDWQTRFKLRNEWVDVNPTEWQERANMTVSVGLGNSSRDEVRQNLSLMAAAQEKLRAGDPGLVQSNNMYALFKRFQTEMGFENDEFATDPKSPEYQQYMQGQQGQKDPFVQGEEIKASANMAGKQLDAQIKREQMAQDRDLKITEMELDAGVDLAKAGIGAEVAANRDAQRAAAQSARGNGAAAP